MDDTELDTKLDAALRTALAPEPGRDRPDDATWAAIVAGADRRRGTTARHRTLLAAAAAAAVIAVVAAVVVGTRADEPVTIVVDQPTTTVAEPTPAFDAVVLTVGLAHALEDEQLALADPSGTDTAAIVATTDAAIGRFDESIDAIGGAGADDAELATAVDLARSRLGNLATVRAASVGGEGGRQAEVRDLNEQYRRTRLDVLAVGRLLLPHLDGATAALDGATVLELAEATGATADLGVLVIGGDGRPDAVEVLDQLAVAAEPPYDRLDPGTKLALRDAEAVGAAIRADALARRRAAPAGRWECTAAVVYPAARAHLTARQDVEQALLESRPLPGAPGGTLPTTSGDAANPCQA